MLNLEEFETIFNQKDDYEIFCNSMETLFYDIKKEYSYVNASDKAWENLFMQILRYFLNKDKAYINIIVNIVERKVRNVIKRDIKKELDNNTTIIINNFILRTRKNNTPKNTIILLKRELEYFEIRFDEQIYDNLKNYSNEFKKLLEVLKIEDFSYQDFNNYFEGKYDLYISLKPMGMKLSESIKLINSYIELYDLQDRKMIRCDKSSLPYKHIKFLIRNYFYFEEIYKMFCDYFKYISKISFFKILITRYKINELESLVLNYSNYCAFGKKDDLFLNVIYSKGQDIIEENQKQSQPDDIYLKKLTDIMIKAGEKENNLMREKIYLLFYDLSEEERLTVKRLIDEKSFDYLDKKEAEKIILSMKAELSNYLNKIKEDTSGIIYEKIKYNLGEYLNKYIIPLDVNENDRALYENIIFILEEKISSKDKKLIYKYFEKKVQSNSEVYCKLKRIKNKVLLYFDFIKGLKDKYKTLYDYIYNDNNVYCDKTILDEVFQKLDNDEQKQVNKFLNGKFVNNIEESIKAIDIIILIKHKYNTIFKNVYNYIITNRNLSKEMLEKHMSIVDRIIKSLSDDEQNTIYKDLVNNDVLTKVKKLYQQYLTIDPEFNNDDIKYLLSLSDNINMVSFLKIYENALKLLAIQFKAIEVKYRKYVSKNEYLEIITTMSEPLEKGDARKFLDDLLLSLNENLKHMNQLKR